MVGATSIAAMIFSMVVALLLPLVLIVILYIKKRISLLSALVGALVFLVFQLLTRIPLLRLLGTTPFYQQMAGNLVLLGLFLGLTAGLFEEVGRYLAFRFLLKGRWQIKNGVAYGLGHGGFEAFVLVGLTYVNNLVYSLAINAGRFDQTIGPALGPAAGTVKQALTQTPAYIFALAGVERIFALSIQVALSLVVLFALRRNNLVYLLYAIVLHALVDFPLVFIGQIPNGVLWAELYVLVLAAVAFIFILRTWKKDEIPETEEAESVEGPQA